MSENMDNLVEYAGQYCAGTGLETVNSILSKYDISLKYISCEQLDGDELGDDAGKILYSIQTDAHEYPVAVNAPMLAKFVETRGFTTRELELQCLGTLWHEAGHAICDHFEFYNIFDNLPDEEELVEEFSDYMMRKYTGKESSLLLNLMGDVETSD